MAPIIGQFVEVLFQVLGALDAARFQRTQQGVTLLGPQGLEPGLDVDGDTLLRDVASAVSIATGLPSYDAARPLGYLAGVMEVRIDPTSPVDAVRGARTGAASPESKVR